MTRKIVYISLTLVILAAVGAYYLVNYRNAYVLNQTGIEGMVRKLDHGWWGIESYGLIERKILVKNLPKQFQKNGIEVRCNVVILDTLSGGEWNVISEVNNCGRL